MLDKNYVDNLGVEKNKFADTLKLISGKLKSEKYVTALSGFLKTHAALILELDKAEKKLSEKDHIYFEKEYTNFFKKECIAPNIDALP